MYDMRAIPDQLLIQDSLNQAGDMKYWKLWGNIAVVASLAKTEIQVLHTSKPNVHRQGIVGWFIPFLHSPFSAKFSSLS